MLKRLRFETVNRAVSDVGFVMRDRNRYHFVISRTCFWEGSTRWLSRHQTLEECLERAEFIRAEFGLPTNLVAYRLRRKFNERRGKRETPDVLRRDRRIF
jgi:hypothetical protein